LRLGVEIYGNTNSGPLVELTFIMLAEVYVFEMIQWKAKRVSLNL